MHRKFILMAISVALPAILLVNEAGADSNLVGDGDFSSGYAAWHDWDPETTSAAVTAGGAISLEAKEPAVDGQWAGVTQCVLMPSDAIPYQVSATVVIPGGQARHGYASVRVQAWGTPDCGNPGEQLKDHQLGLPGTHNVSYEVTPFAGAKAFRISIAAVTSHAGPGDDSSVAFRAEFDDVSIVPNGEIPATATPTATPTEPQPASISPTTPAGPPATSTENGTQPAAGTPEATSTPTAPAKTSTVASGPSESPTRAAPGGSATEKAGGAGSQGEGAEGDGGGGSGPVLPIAVGALVLGGIGTTAIAIRRRRSADEEEA